MEGGNALFFGLECFDTAVQALPILCLRVVLSLIFLDFFGLFFFPDSLESTRL